MLSSSATYKTAIHGPHQLAFEVDLYDGPGGALLENNVTIFGGSVTANLAQRVTRSGTFTLGPEYWPTLPTSVLSPYHTVANIRAGIQYGDGSREVFDIITGRVGDVVRDDDGKVSARIDDLAADVVGARFEQPRNSENVTVVDQCTRLITDVLPAASFGPHDVDTTAMTPKLTWDEDRGKALDDLTDALGARWYCLGNGSFVFRRFPYDVGTVVQRIEDGPGGLLVSGTPSITRDGAANSVTVVVERFDGGTPFRVTARDGAPGSPTLYGGPFGTVNQVIKVQTPLTLGEATDYARAQLNASTALSSRWGVAMEPDYTLEPGDTVFLGSRGVTSTQLIDTITYPLQPGVMALGTRAYMRAQATLT